MTAQRSSTRTGEPPGAVRTNPVVKTRHGEVRGSVVDGVNVFKGIPYAAPPFGANRLRAPRPVEAWSGVRDALTFGPEPPQLRPPPQIAALLPDPAVLGEDCLNLNIWSPALGSARQRWCGFLAGCSRLDRGRRTTAAASPATASCA